MTESEPVLDQINVVVTDMEATLAFYRAVGLTIPDTESEWEQHHRMASAAGEVSVDFDAGSVGPGHYSTTLCIDSNDPLREAAVTGLAEIDRNVSRDSAHRRGGPAESS
jgi:hypothetical protein